MRRIGGHVSIAGGLTSALDRTKEIGGSCLQIFAGSPRTWARTLYLDRDVANYREAAAASNLQPLFIHALYLVNLGSDQPELLNKSATSLRFDLQNGDALGAEGVIVHLGSHQGRGFVSVKDQVATAVSQLLAQSKSTKFLIENSAGQKGKIGTLEEIRDLVAQINHPRLGVCLDTAHLFEAGFDLTNAQAVDQLVNTLLEYGLLERLSLIHLNDSKTALGSAHDNHANLGEGEIGLEGLRNFVAHPKLVHLPLILEVPGAQGWPDKPNIDLAKSL